MRHVGRHTLRANSRGFSLIELVIVVVIIGIIGAIAIPRLSRGSEGASDAALRGDLAVLRNAIDHYAVEHAGTYPQLASFEDQILSYTDVQGGESATKTTVYIFGPYLRKIPALPVGTNAGHSSLTNWPGTANCGWVYNETTGDIKANTTIEKDARGTLYRDH